ncbi:hypothetical protein ABE29_18805 [Cytobacillus firmus]|nr:hypothetical protein [Cytobacillus firmus]MBG9554047.1 hypothetical protein [Cytobacillus firmus]MBG9558489.1 hypothetical protein [Cytobacillus firmus]MBG9577084.1 hypothetical protein [Cytobacillus firmus]
MITQYTGLLDTMEEAFDYVLESFTDFQRTEGDRVLIDIFAGLEEVAKANLQLTDLFQDETSIMNALNGFDTVVEKAGLLEGSFSDPSKKAELVKNHIFPAFSAWKSAIREELKPYSQI